MQISKEELSKCDPEGYFNNQANNVDHESKKIFMTKKTRIENLVFFLVNRVPVGPNLSEDMQTLWVTKIGSDLKLVLVNGEEIAVHRSILAVRSSYFSSMFQSKFSESEKSVISLTEEQDLLVFKHLLEHIYTGEVSHLDPSNCVAYLVKSSYYCLDSNELNAFCAKILEDNLSPDNVLSLYQDSLDLGNEILRSVAMKYIIKNNTQLRRKMNDIKQTTLLQILFEVNGFLFGFMDSYTFFSNFYDKHVTEMIIVHQRVIWISI